MTKHIPDEEEVPDGTGDPPHPAGPHGEQDDVDLTDAPEWLEVEDE